jgi:hypothetical protein
MNDNSTIVKGVIFRRTIRASYASLDLVLKSPDSKDKDSMDLYDSQQGQHIIALIQFHIPEQPSAQQDPPTPTSNQSSVSLAGAVTACRSHIRRVCKLGTEVELIGGKWLSSPSPNSTTNSTTIISTSSNIHNNASDTSPTPPTMRNKAKRFQLLHTIVHQASPTPNPACTNNSSTTETTNCTFMSNTSNSSSHVADGVVGVGAAGLDTRVKVIQLQKWDMPQCQAARKHFYPSWGSEPTNDHHHHVTNPANLVAVVDSSTRNNKNKNNANIVHTTSSTTTTTTTTTKKPSLSNRKKKSFEKQTGHGGGIGKRRQGEVVAEFLVQVIVQHLRLVQQNSQSPCCTNSADAGVELDDQDDTTSTSTTTMKDISHEERTRAIDFLNQGTGVMDAAGGSGHVSLALGLGGIRSTVIDPRENVGRLPGRDRKVLRKAIKEYNHDDGNTNGKRVESTTGTITSTSATDTTTEQGSNKEETTTGTEEDLTTTTTRTTSQGTKKRLPLPPPVQFSSYRAWFGTRPKGVDLEFREGQGGGNGGMSSSSSPETEMSVPICSMCSADKLLPTASAIVALHPDEATGGIVDFAVKHKIPFLVVPCCVFSRLFPNRFKPLKQDSPQREIVSTYDDLIDYLMNKDSSIQMTQLDFDGANKSLWSIFPK